MLKKLKKELIRTNVIIITIMMGLAFLSVYLVVQNMSNQADQIKLQSASASAQSGPGMIDVETGQMQYSTNLQSSSLSFSLVLDSSNQLQEKGLLISADAAKALLQQTPSSDNGSVNYQNRNYIYQKTAFSAANRAMVDGSSNNSVQTAAPQQSQETLITYLDVTDSHKLLNSLLLVFCFAGAGLFVVIVLISIYFANRSIRPVAEAWEQQERFIADASHELKTPVAVITANNEALYQNRTDPKEVEKWSDNIALQTERMSKLIQGLLELARLKNQSSTDPQDFELSDVAQEEIIAMEALIYEKGITLEKEIQPGLTYRGNRDKAAQVLRILLDNAAKYCSQDGTIKICLYKEKTHLLLSVANTGTPIPEESLPHLFDRFYKADVSRKEDGSFGLGLAIAKEIVEDASGSMKVHNQDGWVVFTVRI